MQKLSERTKRHPPAWQRVSQAAQESTLPSWIIREGVRRGFIEAQPGSRPLLVDANDVHQLQDARATHDYTYRGWPDKERGTH